MRVRLGLKASTSGLLANSLPFSSEENYRRKGLALEALRLLLQYATSPTHSEFSVTSPFPIPAESLIVRIGAANVASIALFERLGFSISKKVEVFNEVEMKFAYEAESSHRNVSELVLSWTEAPMEEIEFE